MHHRWGREGADAIYAIATTRLVLGGIGEDEDLRRLSTLVGEHRVRRQSTSRNRGPGCGGGGGSTSTTSSYDWEPVLRPAQIRELPEGQALMFYRNRKAAVMRLRGLWQRTDWDAVQQNKARAEARSQPRVAA